MGWDIFSIFFLYWAENVIIGLFVLLIMLALNVRKGILGIVVGLFPMAFFTVHYGFFCAGHITIIAELFAGDGIKYTHGKNILLLFQGARLEELFWGIVGLAVSQAFQSYNLWQVRYSKAKDAGHIMVAPYGRIMLLHVAILVGGLFAQELGSPIWALMVLIGLKTLYDVIALDMRQKDERASKNSEEI